MLHGLRVLDLTFYLPGPYATLFLADLGAEVVKIENPAGGDPLRGLGPEGASPAGSVLFQAINRGKKSVTLDLKTPEGRDLFLRLAATADAVIEQFRPGVVRRLGIDYDAVRAANPKITYVSLTGYGQSGPLAGEAGHDLNYMARSGLLSLFLGEASGADVDRSRLPPIQIADLFGGCLSAVALLAGMLSAKLGDSGGGRHLHLDVSMTDGLFSLLTMTAANHLATGGQPPRRANLFLAGGEPFYNVYRTADGKLLSIGALEPKFWTNLCAVLAESDPEKKGAAVIGASTAEAARVFATRTAAEWLSRLEGLDVCVAPVLTVEEALASDLARDRGAVVRAAGTRQIGTPLKRVGAGPARGDVVRAGAAAAEPAHPACRPSPRLGESNREVLLSLGLGEADIAGLAARGVISG